MNAAALPWLRRRVLGAPRTDPEILSFQDDLDALVAQEPPLLLRLWPALGAGLFAALIAAASIARIDIVVSTPVRFQASGAE